MAFEAEKQAGAEWKALSPNRRREIATDHGLLRPGEDDSNMGDWWMRLLDKYTLAQINLMFF